ncbi:uncharacterized protein [Venturia canescens]|uniref:uncharacterized protein n=1 Tax=Venturia canescens TaxID=32260 RepID=UPI001C9C2F18|nr:uncharacterized protein LOC122409024 [Venturia canescens]XP_043272156.1 uncharacterized protein LOC122409024 [Venturia canescens]
MEERSELSKSTSRGHKSTPGHSRKSSNKKRTGRKGTTSTENWGEETSPSQNGGPLPNMDYRQIFWPQQTAVPQHIQPPHSGQRLFAAMSDPSVCRYSPLPVAYTMEPVPPMYPLYQPISRPNYRTFRGRPRRHVAQINPMMSQPHPTLTNGYSSLQENRSNYSNPLAYQNGDYASLPPNANTDRSNNCDELNSEHRRYSDPGLGPADLTRPNDGEDSDSAESGSSITTIGKNNKLVLSLVEQMTALREVNSQMFKELHETRTDLESIKSELARLKRGGTSDYQPGMLSDIVRDMREANKALDEAMITKVNAMVDEQNRQRTMEFEKLREQLTKITVEKEDNCRRIVELEETVAALKLNANNEGREIAAFEEETLALRRELQEARASRNMAENHVAKCVRALSRPITPVIFETPCITSTPVRTEFHNNPYLSLSRTGSMNDFSEISASTHATNLESTEGTSSLQPDDNTFRRLSSSSTSSSTSSSPSSFSRCEDRAAEIDEEWRWRATRLQDTIVSSEVQEKEPEISTNGIGLEVDSERAREREGATRDYGVSKALRSMQSFSRAQENIEENEANERLIVIPKNDDKLLADDGKPRSRRSTDKSLTKKDSGNSIGICSSSSATSNAFSEDSIERRNDAPDVLDETPIAVNDDSTSGIVRNDVANKKSRKRAITEVPDVIVVAGKPVVPKDLCSTRILTSSVLTRATYTTAYI